MTVLMPFSVDRLSVEPGGRYRTSTLVADRGLFRFDPAVSSYRGIDAVPQQERDLAVVDVGQRQIRARVPGCRTIDYSIGIRGTTTGARTVDLLLVPERTADGAMDLSVDRRGRVSKPSFIEAIGDLPLTLNFEVIWLLLEGTLVGA